MKNLFILTIFLLFTGVFYAQSSTYTSEPLKEYRPIVTPGTYQVILKDSRMLEPELTVPVLNQIVVSRKQTEVSYIQLDQYTTIKILPFDVINGKNFVPLKEFIYEN